MKASVTASIVLGLVCAGLSAAVVVTVSQNRELTAQLEGIPSKTGADFASADAARLRDLLEQEQTANMELRNELAKLKRAGTNDTRVLRRTAIGGDSTNRPPRGGGPGGNAWLDRLRQEDPARYKQIVEQREQRRRAAEQWYQDTVNQLDQRAASAPTQAEAELATQIADTLAKLNDLRQQWQALRELPEEQRQAQMTDLVAQTRQLERQLRDLSQQDRTQQLQSYANSLGIADEAGQQDFASGISAIYSNTNYRAIIGGGGPGGDFGGRRGPPPSNAGSGTTSQSPAPQP
jgi:DNA repair exonuclease SbcCD ATPase subunit